MADVKLERKEALTREEAAQWLSVLSKAFARGGDVTLPLGSGGTVELRLPNRVRAEFEVEVSGDEVEVELEFTWSTARPPDDGHGGSQGRGQGNGHGAATSTPGVAPGRE